MAETVDIDEVIGGAGKPARRATAIRAEYMP